MPKSCASSVLSLFPICSSYPAFSSFQFDVLHGPMLYTHHYVMRNGFFLTCTRAACWLLPTPHSSSLIMAFELPRKSYRYLVRLRIGVVNSVTTCINFSFKWIITLRLFFLRNGNGTILCCYIRLVRLPVGLHWHVTEENIFIVFDAGYFKETWLTHPTSR